MEYSFGKIVEYFGGMPQTICTICFTQLLIEMMGVRVALAKESLMSVIKVCPRILAQPLSSTAPQL